MKFVDNKTAFDGKGKAKAGKIFFWVSGYERYHASAPLHTITCNPKQYAQ